MPDYLIDTSVLLRFFNENDPQSEGIKATIERIFAGGSPILFTPQVARESWVVATRPPAVGGFGRSPESAAVLLKEASRLFRFVSDTPGMYELWIDLVTRLGVSGRQAHDAYHVAAMKAHGLTHVLTIDVRDFSRYPEISVVRPSSSPDC